jgi:dTMP kinase
LSRGRFITLEGGEGVGKSTQARSLAAALATRGLSVTLTREPGGSAGAEAIRQLVLEGAGDRWGPEAEALLFAAARADHVARLIRPRLDRGDWVICDRFVDSMIAYQGAASGLPEQALRSLHEFASSGLMPDRTLLLTLPEEKALGRLRARDGDGGDRFGARDACFHARVSAAFERLAAEDPQRIRKIAADGDPDAVTARLLLAIDAP